MSVLRTAAASSSRALRASPAPLPARALSTSAAASAPRASTKKTNQWWELEDMPTYKYDDATSFGHLRLLRIDAVRSLVSKMTADQPALAAQARPFTPPPEGALRVTSTMDLANPNSSYDRKRVLVAPISSLPLKTPEAIKRFKLLAGPRWTPGFPGRNEFSLEVQAEGENAHGYIKMAEDRYPTGRMNRKAVSDTLERLVAAANDTNSPLSADTPVDTRHLLARMAKKRQRWGLQNHARAEALKRRPEVVGGVRGFPKEWLTPEAQAKVEAKKAKN